MFGMSMMSMKPLFPEKGGAGWHVGGLSSKPRGSTSLSGGKLIDQKGTGGMRNPLGCG